MQQVRRLSLLPGDLVLEKSGGGDQWPVGRAVLWNLDVGAVPTNFAARLRPAKDVDGRYLVYVAASLYGSGATERCIKQTTGIQNLDTDAWLETPAPLWPHERQRRIGDFLDDQVTCLDAAATEIRRMRLLAAEAAASRLETVVGSRASASVALGRVLRHSPSYGVLKPEPSAEPDAVPLLRIMDVDDRGRVDVDGAMRISREQSLEYSRTRLTRGDVILSVVGTLGRAAVVDDRLAGANISRALCRLVLKPNIEPALIQAQFCTQAFRRFCDDVTRATAQAVLNMGDLVRFKILVPADPGDSARLVDEMAAVQTWRQAAEESSAQLLSLLDERKRALITACVTGEFDVSTASERAGDAALAHLPPPLVALAD